MASQVSRRSSWLGSRLQRREALEGYLWISPWLIGFLVFSLGPIIASFYLSLTKYKIGGTVGGRADVYGSEELLKFPFRVVFKEIMDNAMNSRITANWRQAEAETALAQLMQPLWTGDETPTQEFIDGVSAQIQTILDLPRP